MGYGDRKHNYPLKIDNLELVDSKTHLEIQLADLLASSLSYYFRKTLDVTKEPFLKELADTRFLKLECFKQIGPGLNMDSEKFAKEMQNGGVDGVSFIVEQEQKYFKK